VELLLVGKFPPIEGGVSTQTFWLARALARQGHGVHVVTNSSGIESSYRQCFFGTDQDILVGTDPSTRLDLRVTSEVPPQSYIPYAPPYATQIFGLARSVLEEHPCDAIFAWYLEPYGFVAAALGLASAVPVFIRHAGSDLGRLSANRELREAYSWAMNVATGLIVTNEQEFARCYGTIDRPRLGLRRACLPTDFTGDGDRMNIAEVSGIASAWLGDHRMPAALVTEIRQINDKAFDENSFTIGSYGKIGESKGSFDLIAALTRLAERGATFNFLTIAAGSQTTVERYYRSVLHSRALADRTWILPPLAPWRIPSFLRRCQVVCFLERDFPISFHGPVIPREILSSGACLVCSLEIARKKEYGSGLVDRRTAMVIEDPRLSDVLASRLLELLVNPDLAWAIGHQGQLLFRCWEEDLTSIDDVARGFIQDIGSRAAAPARDRSAIQ